MALVNPCNLEDNVVNTGYTCDDAMKATKKIFLVPPSDRFTMADIVTAGGFTPYAQTRVQDVPAKRWFPIFGSYAPISNIEDATEGDVIQTFPDGSQALVRRGFYNRTFSTSKGGDCYAQLLIRLRAGFSFIEVDEDEKVKFYEPSKDVFGGFPTTLAYGMTPKLWNLTEVFINGLKLSFNSVTYIKNGRTFASTSSEDILALNGLIDVDVTASTTTQTTTNIFVKVISECSETDLTVAFPTQLPVVSNFIVKNKATGVVVTPSAAAIVGTDLRLTGTFVSGQNYTVALAGADVLFGNHVVGYDGVTTATVTIP